MNGLAIFHDRQILQRGSFWELSLWLIGCLDETDLVILAMLAVFIQQVARKVWVELPWRDTAKCLTVLFLLGFALHLAVRVDVRQDSFEVMVLLIRASLASYLFYLCVAAPAVFGAHLVTLYFQTEWQRRRRRFSQDLAQQDQLNRTTQQSPLPAPEPVPREAVLRRSADQARLDYEFECQIIRSAGLDEDELEAALTQAKQKHLQCLGEALQ
ncbi:MAG: hypothetical protein HZA46_18040 [Planctomycetales bacterium]|nr:hypothetical protein [Planctomycetales bacterium]